ncbi:Uma2 family endonuclease [Roseofilum casamattae]|uniref:Uma2 family endonuclease n=1 Tax=Roseofilum casamattae BLCC-M143 TaxID=3022442 RepID=A0ABT7BVU9_9CYAN|nr:Uma2 family endonuclease [Roseofilum casamattae]MDJ1183315.1 Uma2 family endonuclease [Roseofilum casamattae BLCC-M143]
MIQLQSKQLEGTSPDQRIVHSGISWEQFQWIRSGFGDRRNVQLFYYQNTVEILMPGREHELFSRLIGFLIGLYCLEMGIEFEPLGSTTQEREGLVAVEPDESYCFGNSKPTPDLAIEVIFTSGSLNKLQRYRALGISEVWFWEDGVFSLYRLQDEDYRQISRSEIPELSHLDMELLTRCVLMAQTSHLEAAKTFRSSI